jgi:hypothetical protein
MNIAYIATKLDIEIAKGTPSRDILMKGGVSGAKLGGCQRGKAGGACEAEGARDHKVPVKICLDFQYNPPPLKS